MYHSVNNVFQIYGKHVKYTLENIVRIVVNIKGRKHVGVLCVNNLAGYYQSGYFSEEKYRGEKQKKEFSGFFFFFFSCVIGNEIT